MKQYCRYCAYAVQPMEGDVWCDELNKMMSEQSAKTVNHCKHFVFNEIDVFDLDGSNENYADIEVRRVNYIGERHQISLVAWRRNGKEESDTEN